MELIREIRQIDSEQIVINIPKTFRKRQVEIIVFPLEQEAKGHPDTGGEENETQESSGLCGIWKDERSADEIVEDIYAHRTGFGKRKVEL